MSQYMTTSCHVGSWVGSWTRKWTLGEELGTSEYWRLRNHPVLVILVIIVDLPKLLTFVNRGSKFFLKPELVLKMKI